MTSGTLVPSESDSSASCSSGTTPNTLRRQNSSLNALPSPRHGPSLPSNRQRSQHNRRFQGSTYNLSHDENWKNWTQAKLKIWRLPAKVSTWDLYQQFSDKGTIVKVDIVEARNEAYITFCPPPNAAFWRRNNIKWKPLNGASVPVSLNMELQNNRGDQLVQSPSNPSQKYPERIPLPARSIEFGFMHSHSSMMVMKTVIPTPEKHLDFELDLLARKLAVRFPLERNSNSKDADKSDCYRFRIPLDKVTTVYVEELPGNMRSIIIPLDAPPEFCRQIKDVQSTHDPKVSFWSEWRTWFRQTDIVNDCVQLEVAPIRLRKDDAIIDIGRWTTYRLTFDESKLGRTFRDLFNAFRDYNIRVVEQPIALLPKQDASVWNHLDLPDDKNGELHDPYSELFEMEQGVKYLPFEVRYQLEVCLSHGYLHEHNITEEFLRTLAALDDLTAVDILEQVANMKQRFFDPLGIFTLRRSHSSHNGKLPRYCTLSRSAVVTPTMIYYSTPAVEISNRVIRHWSDVSDRFLRVRFTDELNCGRIHSQDGNTQDEVFARILRVLKNGILLGDRKYEFLAFGNSQFREHGAYFFSPTPKWSAQDIRDYLGELDPKDQNIPAKWCARLGQNFSTTRGIHTTVFVKDVCTDIQRNGYNFTDGVGKVSPFLVRLIAEEFGLPSEDPPSVFQFRLGGCKGVLAVAPDVPNHEIHIRPSQVKFAAVFDGLEVIRTSSFVTAMLNRQIIIVLSTLGVPDETFRAKLATQLRDLEKAMIDEKAALRELQKSIDFNQITLTLAAMVLDGFMQAEDPFMMSMLKLWRSWSIKHLKERAKIPIANGACLFGCVDETATLKGHYDYPQPLGDASWEEKTKYLPEVFCYVDRERKGIYEPVEGLCILARNPSLHPGDVRIVRAVDNPRLHHLKNVVVLPQTGDRDLGNMCSGGDLDGDDYLIIWDQDLIPEEWNHPAMDFTPVSPRRVEGQVTANEMVEFFVTYMKNDRLPTIAHAHLAMADSSEWGVKDQRCLQLAQLHSQAVDFPKSGVPVAIPQSLRPKRWPHFMEKFGKSKSAQYKSQKILGQLYDMVVRIDFKPEYGTPFDDRILGAYQLDSQVLQQATEIKEQYDERIRRVMAQHDIDTEFEVWSAFVMKHNGEKRDYSFAEELGRVMSAIKENFRKVCIDKAGGDSFEKLQPFVAAMYTVTAQEIQSAKDECYQTTVVGGKEVPLRMMDEKNMPFMSFPWLFDRELGKIASGTLHTRESIKAQQGIPKRMPKRSAANFMDDGAAVETTEGVVHKGDVFKPTFDRAVNNSVPKPVQMSEKDLEEHARMIDSAIEGNLPEPAFSSKRHRLQDLDFEAAMVRDMSDLKIISQKFPVETRNMSEQKRIKWYRDGEKDGKIMPLALYEDLHKASTSDAQPHHQPEDAEEGLESEILGRGECVQGNGDEYADGENRGVVEIEIDLGLLAQSSFAKFEKLVGLDSSSDEEL